MSPFVHLFSDYKEVDETFVLMANDKHCRVNGIGNIKLELENGFLLEHKNVKHVPELT